MVMRADFGFFANGSDSGWGESDSIVIECYSILLRCAQQDEWLFRGIIDSKVEGSLPLSPLSSIRPG